MGSKHLGADKDEGLGEVGDALENHCSIVGINVGHKVNPPVVLLVALPWHERLQRRAPPPLDLQGKVESTGT
eukprot:746034-Hanusia_phi.AAC.3